MARALRLISEGVLDTGSVEDLAARLGIGARQLRRLFLERLGASPLKIAITHRVHFARNLIEETNLPITQIALSSGFTSIRQFNHAFRLICEHSPTHLRVTAGGNSQRSAQGGLVIRLRYRPPLDWKSVIQFLKARAVPGVEVVEEDSYQRTISVGDVVGAIAVHPHQTEPFLTVRIDLPGYQQLMNVVERVRRIFDLGADPLRIADDLSRDFRLKPLIECRPGLRVPGAWDGFELAVRAILGERLTFTAAKAVVGRLVRAFGRPVQNAVPGLTHAFPKPEDLIDADFSKIGVNGQRADTIKLLAKAVSNGALTFSGFVSLEAAISRIQSIRGISRRTAHYIAMRALGEPDAFPAVDRVRKRLSWDRRHSSTTWRSTSEAWRPWRAYALLHLCSAQGQDHR